MKLCKHLEPIYQNEIRKENSIVYLGKWNHYLIVYLKNKMENYSMLPDVIFAEEKDYHFPFSEQYVCKECHCAIWGLFEENQKDRYQRDSFTQFCEKAVATLDTVEIEDEVWNTMSSTMVPKMIGFEDRY